jgi:outer membrane protein insertion porin family
MTWRGSSSNPSSVTVALGSLLWPTLVRRALTFALLLLAVAPCARAFEPFTAKDIRVEGLRRLSAGTVFNYLPIQVGERVDDRRARQAIHALYKTGFFRDVSLDRDGDVLVVSVEERPSIDAVDITGNRALDTKQLKEALERVGLARGRVFNRSLLDRVEQELQRQYFSLGRYGVQIKTTVTPLERNRVAIAIQIAEGQVAKIRRINVVGNRSYPAKTLLKQFKLGTPNWLSFYTKNDQYSKQKLAADLESLRSFYLDRGYINFSIDSTQVSITPDKKDVYITVGITEGSRFKVKDVKVTGDTVVPKAELLKLVEVKPGEVFSRQSVTETATRLSDRLGKEGYAFANVNAIPDVNENTKEVGLTFFVDPGRRAYVNRINIKGNLKTRDEVIRREVRQMEAGLLSTEKVKTSRSRLDRLGYFEEVNVETPAVPGTTDQVDVNFNVTERPSGNLLAGVGYSQSQGVLVNASVTQDNFLGTGKRVSAAFSNSSVNRIYSFDYTNPYYTINGVSRGFSLFYRQTYAGQANIGPYTSDDYGGNLRYGIPLGEFDSLRAGVGYEGTKIQTQNTTPPEYIAYLDEFGDQFNAPKLTGGWTHDTRDRAIFPNSGLLHTFDVETALPAGDLAYYKISLRDLWYRPIGKKLVASLRGDVGYGNGFDGTPQYPFFENFYAGGIRSVRGFKDNTLGPRSVNGDPLGGNFRLDGSAEVLFPPPFLGDTKAIRLGVFVDAGQVYGPNESYDLGQLRYSTGISTQWFSPLGPLQFSVAKALNAKKGDDTQIFQFSIGAAF